jgi:hypothetical protein
MVLLCGCSNDGGNATRRDDMTTRYNCVSDRYDQCPTDTYTLDEFQAMCLELFGEEADLRADGDNYRDETGAIVLEEAGA